MALKTSLQKPSLSSLSLPKKQSQLNSQISSENTLVNLKNLSNFSHNLTKFPIHLQGKTKNNSIARKKQSSHNNSCGCPICRKPTRLTPTVQRAKHNQQFTPIDSFSLQTNANRKLTIKNNFVSAKSSEKAATNTTVKNSSLVDKKVTPMIQGGFFSKIKKRVKKFGSKVKKTFNKATSKVKKTFSKVGKKIKKFGKYVWSGVKWFSKQLWSKLTGIFFRVIRWIVKLPTRIKRLLLHIWQGVKSLKPWSLKWWKSLGNLSTWKGLLSWLGTSLVYLLEIAGVGEVYETVMDFVKFNTRPLTASEIAKARTVFGNSINYHLVRVDKTAVIGPSFSGRAYVSFQTINAWGTVNDHTFIHELTHVWQYEKMGAIYMPKAIHAQEFGAGYDYGDLRELRTRQRNGQRFNSFNLEQQGQILGDYYIARNDPNTTAPDLQTYEYFVSDVRS